MRTETLESLRTMLADLRLESESTSSEIRERALSYIPHIEIAIEDIENLD